MAGSLILAPVDTETPPGRRQVCYACPVLRPVAFFARRAR